MRRQAGLTFLELIFTTALIATVLAIGLPLFTDAIDSHRTASAARYIAGRISLARFEAVKRSTRVGLKFEAAGSDYRYAAYADGNANGIRTLDIRIGVDVLLMEAERVGESYRLRLKAENWMNRAYPRRSQPRASNEVPAWGFTRQHGNSQQFTQLRTQHVAA